MTRLIPGKTKVEVELFRSVTLGDIVLGGLALGMISLVLVSGLPHKYAICLGIAFVAGLLLTRIDTQANYLYLLHILRHFGYDRHFARLYTDEALVERGEGRGKEAAFRELFAQDPFAAQKPEQERRGAEEAENGPAPSAGEKKAVKEARKLRRQELKTAEKARKKARREHRGGKAALGQRVQQLFRFSLPGEGGGAAECRSRRRAGGGVHQAPLLSPDPAHGCAKRALAAHGRRTLRGAA